MASAKSIAVNAKEVVSFLLSERVALSLAFEAFAPSRALTPLVPPGEVLLLSLVRTKLVCKFVASGGSWSDVHLLLARFDADPFRVCLRHQRVLFGPLFGCCKSDTLRVVSCAFYEGVICRPSSGEGLIVLIARIFDLLDVLSLFVVPVLLVISYAGDFVPRVFCNSLVEVLRALVCLVSPGEGDRLASFVADHWILFGKANPSRAEFLCFVTSCGKTGEDKLVTAYLRPALVWNPRRYRSLRRLLKFCAPSFLFRFFEAEWSSAPTGEYVTESRALIPGSWGLLDWWNLGWPPPYFWIFDPVSVVPFWLQFGMPCVTCVSDCRIDWGGGFSPAVGLGPPGPLPVNPVGLCGFGNPWPASDDGLMFGDLPMPSWFLHCHVLCWARRGWVNRGHLALLLFFLFACFPFREFGVISWVFSLAVLLFSAHVQRYRRHLEGSGAMAWYPGNGDCGISNSSSGIRLASLCPFSSCCHPLLT